MLSTVFSLVPVAAAAAMSTVPISVMLLILLSPEPRRGAVPFLLGSVAGSVVVVGLATIGLRSLPVVRPWKQDQAVAVTALLLGLFLIGYAVFLFTHGRRKNRTGLEKIAQRFRTARSWEFTALGLGLNLRPKALLLAVTAGALISVQNPSAVQQTFLVVVYAAAAQSTIIFPITAWLKSPERARARLATVYSWLQRNGRRVTAAVMLALGILLAGYGLVQLL